MTGCGQLSFNPSLSVTGTTAADSPAGVDVDVHVPPAPDTASTLATPDLENAVVNIPPAIALSPAAADGLQACIRISSV